MNTQDFFRKYPALRRKETDRIQMIEGLSELMAFQVFDLMMDSDSSILSMVIDCVADCLMDERGKVQYG